MVFYSAKTNTWHCIVLKCIMYACILLLMDKYK